MPISSNEKVHMLDSSIDVIMGSRSKNHFKRLSVISMANNYSFWEIGI